MEPCLRNGGLVNVDKISQLPEPLLVHILSSLPTKDVVATSVLSKQWKSLWKIVPKIKLVHYDIESKHETFSEIVCRLLLSNKAPVVEILHLNFSLDNCDAMDIGICIGIAYARHLRELVLDVDSEIGPFKFPRSLYNCETLETLILRAWVLIDVPSSVCFKSLRTLHLDSVDYKDDASVVNLLSGCPDLENLFVYRGESDPVVKIFTIAVPSLQRLTIYDGQEQTEGYVINTLSLNYLKIQGITSPEFRLIEIASELVEANIMNASITIDEKLRGSLTSVKRLSLTLSPLEYLLSVGIFGATYRETEWWNLLLLMLNCSPKLQVLKLIGQKYCEKERVACQKWNQPKNVSECLMLHLETFVWSGYKEQLEEEKEVAKYILRNAKHLKRATFSIKGLNSDETLEMLEELEILVRPSNSSCKLLLLLSE